MDFYMYFDWIHNLNTLIVMYSVLYTLRMSLFSYSVSTKVECQSALLKGLQSFVCCYVVLSITSVVL